jgi:hypothetical protein
LHGRGTGRAGNVSISVSHTRCEVAVTVVARAWVDVSESLKPAATIVRAESFFYGQSWKITLSELAHAWEIARPQLGENVACAIAIVLGAFWSGTISFHSCAKLEPQPIKFIIERKAVGTKSVFTKSLLPVCKSR